MRPQELSKVPGDLMLVPIVPSLLPASFPAPIKLVLPAVASVVLQGVSAGYPPWGPVPPSAVGITGKKKGKKAASFAKVTVKASITPGPPKPSLGPKAALAQLQGQAQNTPPPPRPSLVLSLTHHMLASTLRTTAALTPPCFGQCLQCCPCCQSYPHQCPGFRCEVVSQGELGHLCWSGCHM